MLMAIAAYFFSLVTNAQSLVLATFDILDEIPG